MPMVSLSTWFKPQVGTVVIGPDFHSDASSKNSGRLQDHCLLYEALDILI